jgi:excinuclease ABC subunit C
LVLTNYSVPESDLIAQALSVKAERRVHLSHPRRGSKRKLIDHAELNAREALGRRVAESASQRRLLEGVAQAFSMESPPDRIEVYDNSHIQGTHSVGAMIVSGAEGFAKSAYRRFNIRNVRAKSDTPGKTPDPVEIDQVVGGDDFAMMRQVLTRRFERALREDPDRAMGTWPELILIDGGAGQLGVAREVLSELSIDDVLAVGVAKGPDRDAGRERFFISNRAPFMLERESPVLYFLQRLRDEAHRFAIEGHRARRTKAITRNVLDDVPGIGAKRKKALLHHFGSGRAVSRAGLADLEEVEGISKAVAKRIYDFFRDAG